MASEISGVMPSSALAPTWPLRIIAPGSRIGTSRDGCRARTSLVRLHPGERGVLEDRGPLRVGHVEAEELRDPVDGCLGSRLRSA